MMPGHYFFIKKTEESAEKSKTCRNTAAAIEGTLKEEGPGMSKNKIRMVQVGACRGKRPEATYPSKCISTI
jgi:hypothetical protein